MDLEQFLSIFSYHPGHVFQKPVMDPTRSDLTLSDRIRAPASPTFRALTDSHFYGTYIQSSQLTAPLSQVTERGGGPSSVTKSYDCEFAPWDCY